MKASPTDPSIDEKRERLRRALVHKLEREAPLSFAQERLWFLEQLAPGNATYSETRAFRVDSPGDASIRRLRRVLAEVVRRHEILRTTFATVDGKPVQRIAPSLTPRFPIVDLTGLASEQAAREVQRAARQQASQPFDLTHGPLLHITGLRLEAHRGVAVVTLHHIVADGWSVGVFLREVMGLYLAYSRNRPAPFPEPGIQYADYVRWQRNQLDEPRLSELLAHWRRQLSGLDVLTIPTDRPRPLKRTGAGASHPMSVPPSVMASLKRFSRQEGLTPFMVLLAVFQTMLFRYTGEEDFAVGSPTSGREHHALRDLIGLFINLLVLRADLSEAPTFRELASRTRRMCLTAYAHQELPFEKLVEAIAPERDPTREPLVQVVIGLQPELMEQQLEDVSTLRLEVEGSTSKFDLSLLLFERPTDMHGWFEYSTELYDPSTIARMAQHFHMLLTAALHRPELSVADLPLLSPGERHQLVLEWTSTTSPRRRRVASEKDSSSESVPENSRGCLHAMVARHSSRRPDAIAVVDRDQHLSYAELDRRADRLATFLRERGIGAESRVGICTERTLQMVIALLGVLKSGAAYVPLDPTYPGERLAYMLEDSDASLVVMELGTAKRLDRGAPARVILEELQSSDVASGRRKANPKRVGAVEPGNVAYVIYTSGSTGRPKGVEVSHASAVGLFDATRESFRLDEADVWSSFHSYAFDFSVWEIWGALVHGARLILVPHRVSRDPEQFYDLLGRQRVTVVSQTSSAFGPLVRVDARRSRALSLRLIVFGGEALSPGPVAEWLARHGAQRPRLVNMYGITETTVHVTAQRVARADGGGTAESVVGRAIRDWRVHLLDRQLEPVPIGVPGEIFVGGRGVARAYWQKPSLTAQRFVPDAHNGSGGDRLYRTGDLGKWLVDGRLAYLGRVDHQVKVRGYRIELGEVECVLEQHPSVHVAVVVLRGQGDEAHLVGYVEGLPESAGGELDLKKHLKRRLPDYMIPSSIVFVEELSRLPNGKVDRQSLPEPAKERPELGRRDYVAPRTPIEVELARMWSELLGVARVGIHDNFFELGGHSLLATQLAARIRDRSAVELPLAALFQSPTVAGLAQVLAQAPADTTPRPPLTRRERDGPTVLSFAQQRLWFLDQLSPGNPFYNVAAAVRLSGLIDMEILRQSLAETVRRHEALRTTFRVVNGEPFQVVLASVALDLPLIDLSAVETSRRDAEVNHLAVEDARRPFRLEAGPLIRLTMIRLGEQEHVALINMHHIISDGWSLGVLLHEVAVHYEAVARSEPSPLPELPIQYGDFALWQREWLSGEVLDRQIAYWREQLAELTPLKLPTDRVRPEIEAFRGSTRSYRLEPELRDRIANLARGEDSTLFMALLAMFQSLLHVITGENDVAVGSAVANRANRELELLIGFFVNTLVLRTDLSGNPSLREVVRRVRHVCLEAFSHQDVPFEKIVAEIGPERDAGRQPLFQVLFLLQNAPLPEVQTPGGLTFEYLQQDSRTAKFDMSWFLWEEGGGLTATVEYNTDLFDDETIAWMIDEFRRVIARFVDNPDARLSDLSRVSEAHQFQELLEWGEGDASRSRGHPRKTR